MEQQVTLEQVFDLAKLLSLTDKIRLIERIAPQIERDLKAAQQAPRKSPQGMGLGADTHEEEIDQVQLTPKSPGDFEHEVAAFEALLPELRSRYPGQVVALYQGKIVGVGSNKMDVLAAVMERYTEASAID